MEVTTFARVDPDTLEVTLMYNTNGGDAWGFEDLPCSIPFDVLADHAVRDSEGNVTLQADPAKLEAKIAQAWTALRTERNARLTASDWTQLPDARVDKDAWVEYRQKLRDLPESVQDPTSVEWPSPPQ